MVSTLSGLIMTFMHSDRRGREGTATFSVRLQASSTIKGLDFVVSAEVGISF